VSRLFVIRFGSLGDLCLLAWTLTERFGPGSLAHRTGRGSLKVTLVTKAGFADLAAQIPGVDRVVPLRGSRLQDLWRLAAELGPDRDDLLVDAHNVLRSRLLLLRLGRRPVRRLAKDTVARLALLHLRRRSARLQRTMRERFEALFDFEPIAGQEDRQPSPPLAHLAGNRSAETLRLGLAPGARWDTKRWPASHFVEFLRRFRQATTTPVSLFLGPVETRWFDGSELAAAASELPDVIVERNLPLPEVAAALTRCATLFTNDSGLLHLAEAVGTPVLALFGPTVREFGYFPGLPASRVLQTELDCRPCSRNGKRSCYRKDKACLSRITPAAALSGLLAMPPWNKVVLQEEHHG
jgi:heptosyltransferase-2